MRKHKLGIHPVELEIRFGLAALRLGLFELGFERKIEPVLAHELLDEILVGDAAVRGIEIDDGLVVAVFDFALADDRIAEMRQKPFHDRFHRGAVAVSLVNLANRELGVVGAVDALVAEILAELENLVHAADEEPLKIKLRRDAHYAILVERVEVRNERLSRGAACLILKNGGFDLHEAAVPEVLADFLDETRAREEAVARLVVRHQVDITAAVALFLVGKAVELLRRLLERLGEHRPLLDDEGLLALLGRKERSFGADDVAEIKLLERGEHRLGKFIALEDKLKFIRTVVHGAEIHFAHATDHHKTTGDARGFTFLEFRADLGEIVVIVLATIGLKAEFGQSPHTDEPLLAIFIRFHSPLLYQI